jgi:hypothetical protein
VDMSYSDYLNWKNRPGDTRVRARAGKGEATELEALLHGQLSDETFDVLR